MSVNRVKRKICPFESGKLDPSCIDYKNVKFIKRYSSESGKIVASRITGLKNIYQHKLARETKIARYLALVQYCDNQ